MKMILTRYADPGTAGKVAGTIQTAMKQELKEANHSSVENGLALEAPARH